MHVFVLQQCKLFNRKKKCSSLWKILVPVFNKQSTQLNQQSVPQYGHHSKRNVQNENHGNEENERVYETCHDCTDFNF